MEAVMDMRDAITIGVAENGFIVKVHVPISDKKSKEMYSMCGEYSDKKYVVMSAAEIAPLIEKLVPLLDMEYTSEDEFDKAFNKAAGAAKPGGENYE
jgi:hypothetical protein